MRKCAGDRSMHVWIRPGGSIVGTARPLGSRGFTLAELVLSLAIMSVLMTGLASAIIIASHALPKDDSPARAVVKAAEVADQSAEELRAALWIRERTATSVEFAVPDRDADGAAERIRYAWSGVAGEALTRQYNGGTVVDIADSVQEFDLGYDLKSVTEEYPGPPVEGEETLLADYDSLDVFNNPEIEENLWCGQYMMPSLPADTISWEVTKVAFNACRSGKDDGEVSVELQLPTAENVPGGVVLESWTLLESTLIGDFSTEEFAASNVSGLSPDQGICLVVGYVAGNAPACMLQGQDQNNKPQIGNLVESTDQGASWSSYTNRTLLYALYGKVGTPGPDQTATRQYVTGVRIKLRTGSAPAARVISTAQTLNTPELLAGMWETDFDADPRLDHNGDGQPDWLDDSGTFTLASVAGGVWTDDSELVTFPDNDFAALTTVKLRFRSISVGGRAVFRIHADQSGGTKVILTARLRLEADGTQTFTFLRNTGPGTSIVVVRVPGLSSSFVDLRLVIDPDLDTVSVTVDGEHKGTHQYSPFVPSVGKRVAKILGDGGTAEFDYVSIRVSE